MVICDDQVRPGPITCRSKWDKMLVFRSYYHRLLYKRSTHCGVCNSDSTVVQVIRLPASPPYCGDYEDCASSPLSPLLLFSSLSRSLDPIVWTPQQSNVRSVRHTLIISLGTRRTWPWIKKERVTSVARGLRSEDRKIKGRHYRSELLRQLSQGLGC